MHLNLNLNLNVSVGANALMVTGGADLEVDGTPLHHSGG